MRHWSFQGWRWLGGLAAAALLGGGCGRLPETGGERADAPPENFFGGPLRGVPPDFYEKYQYSPDRGYNGTIADIGSSIDPRTPEKAGTPGRTLLEDVPGQIGPMEGTTGLGGGGRAGQAAEEPGGRP